MENGDKGKGPFRYLMAVTVISIVLIVLNVLLGMRIPFTVDFLLGYVGAMLVFVVWHAVLTKGWKRSLIMFGLSFIVAFTAEALGVSLGWYLGTIITHLVWVCHCLAYLSWLPWHGNPSCMRLSALVICSLRGWQACHH